MRGRGTADAALAVADVGARRAEGRMCEASPVSLRAPKS